MCSLWRLLLTLVTHLELCTELRSHSTMYDEHCIYVIKDHAQRRVKSSSEVVALFRTFAVCKLTRAKLIYAATTNSIAAGVRLFYIHALRFLQMI
jgi:hypothetical protein